MGEQPPDHARLALHRVQVAGAVAARERHAGDQMVDDQLVEDDEAAVRPERVQDPPVRLRAVADVEEPDVRRTTPPPSRLHDVDVSPTPERGHKQCAVVRDPTPGRRHG